MAWRLIRAVRPDDSVFRPSSPSKLQLHEGTKGRRGRGGGSMRSWWLWKVNGAAQEQYSTGNIGGNCFPPGLLPSTSQVHTMYLLVQHFIGNSELRVWAARAHQTGRPEFLCSCASGCLHQEGWDLRVHMNGRRKEMLRA